MARKLVIIGVAVAGVINDENNKEKEPEKKPVVNIVKDYVCLRDGELCHPDHARNRGLYVSCSKGVAWEQQSPKCSYHPLHCPTRTLWFDGEKSECDWASPELASLPCIDSFPVYEIHNKTEKEVGIDGALAEQESLFQSLQLPQLSVQKEPADKNKWQMSPMSVAVPMYYNKSPKYEEIVREPSQKIDDQSAGEEKEVKAAAVENDAVEEEDEDAEEVVDSNQVESRKSGEEESEPESEFPSYLNSDESILSTKVVRVTDPVYALVNNPNGSGKQVLMRISQPFVLEDSARSGLGLPSLNIISSFVEKE